MIGDHRHAEPSAAPPESRSSPVAQPATLSSQAAVLALQRSVGNAAVSRILARHIDPAQLPTKPAAEIMKDESYIDNGIKKIEFFGAEQATIHYEDGGVLTIGLVPEWITDPIEGVDYRSTKHMKVTGTAPGTFGYIPHGQETAKHAPGHLTYGEFLEQYARLVSFKHDAPSGRVVPTQINSLTAPVLCATLRKAEAEYVAAMDEMAKGMVKALEVLEIVLIIASFLPSGGGGAGARGAAGRGAAAGAGSALGRAQSALLALFKRLLSGGAKPGAEIVVEGVGISGIEVSAGGGRLLARYTHIINIARNPGAGRMAQAAFEQAAVATAKQAGMKTAEVAVHTVVNPKWAAYLESIGYAPEVISTGVQSFSKVWLKRIAL